MTKVGTSATDYEKKFQPERESQNEIRHKVYYPALAKHATLGRLVDYCYQLRIGVANLPHDIESASVFSHFVLSSQMLFQSSSGVHKVSKRLIRHSLRLSTLFEVIRSPALRSLRNRVSKLHRRHPMIRQVVKWFELETHMPHALIVAWIVTAEWLADTGVSGDRWRRAFELLEKAFVTPALPIGGVSVPSPVVSRPLLALAEMWLGEGLTRVAGARSVSPPPSLPPLQVSPFDLSEPPQVENREAVAVPPSLAHLLVARLLPDMHDLWGSVRRWRREMPGLLARVLASPPSRPDTDVSSSFDITALPEPDRTTPWFDPVADRLAVLRLPLDIDPALHYVPV